MVAAQLESLENVGLLKSAHVAEVATEHDRKNRWGRLKDWVCWKTPYRRRHYRPEWIQVPLVDVLERIREHGDPDTAKYITDELLENLHGTTVWERQWPTNPYEVMVFDLSIAPVVPLNYIKATFTIEDDK